MLLRLALGKEKLKTLVTSSELYLVFDKFTQYKGQKKTQFTFIVDRGWR